MSILKRFNFNVLWLCGFIFISSSCKKILDEKPLSFYAVPDFFRDVRQAEMSVMGIYEMMGQPETYGQNILAYATDSDVSQMIGSKLVSTPHGQIGHYAAGPDHSFLEETWRFFYIGIDRANLVIQKIPEMDIFDNGTEKEKKELRRLYGEALFLRGLYYFDLIRFFGDVPLKISPTLATDDMNIPRTDKEIVYDQIFQDFEDAIPLLPWASEKSIDERVSRGAAMGIFARVALFRGGYSLGRDGIMRRPSNYLDYYTIAAQQAKDVIMSGEHKLNQDYEQLFKNYCEFKLEPMESMFEVSFFNLTGAKTNNSKVGIWNSPVTDANNPHGRAAGVIKTYPTFFNSFANGDIRRDISIATYELDANNQKVQIKPNKDNTWSAAKWRKDWQNTSPKNPNFADINWVLLRYSDVLLMYSEAINELSGGPTQEAYDYVDSVRLRAHLDPIQRTMDKETFFEYLIEERAHELCFEGFRKFDLIRWNMLGSKLRETAAELFAHRSNFPFVSVDYFVDGKNELYPIPQHEMDQNTALAGNQNHGYSGN